MQVKSKTDHVNPAYKPQREQSSRAAAPLRKPEYRNAGRDAEPVKPERRCFNRKNG